MSEPARDAPAPVSQLLLIDKICDPFDAAWQAGARPSLEASLQHAPSEARSVVFRELLAIELHCRTAAGESPTPNEYRERFPAFAAEVEDAFHDRSSFSSASTVPLSSVPEVGPAAATTIPERVGDFEIVDELGRGGMGVVYRARQVGLGRLVALKMIRPDRLGGTEELTRFRREAETLARLQHPNIVQVHAFGEHDGQPYFGMELVAGTSLARRLTDGPLPPRDAAALVETLARAVHAAHQQGVIHRDLKPANVLLASPAQVTSDKLHVTSKTNDSPLVTCNLSLDTSTPKVTDFGLAKRLDDADFTVSGAVMGTPSYMAPEQAMGAKEIGPAADVHALGAILYECLTGRPAFRGASPLETLDLVRLQEPVPPLQFNPHLPHDLDTICLKCLQKAPGERYATAEELADDLRRFLAGEPIRARPVSVWEKGWRWARRHKARAAAGLLSVALVLALAACGWLYGLAQSAQRQREVESRDATIRLLEMENAIAQERDIHADALLAEDRLRWRLANDARVRRPDGDTGRREIWEALLEADRAALPRYEALAARTGASLAQRRRPVVLRLRCGRTCQRLGRFDEAAADFTAAIEQALPLADAFPDDRGVQDDLAAAFNNRANLALVRRRRPEAAEDYRRAEAYVRRLHAGDPNNPKYRDDLASCLTNRAALSVEKNEHDRGRPLAEEALALRQALHAEYPQEPRYASNLGATRFLLGDLEAMKGRSEIALGHFEKAIEALDPVVRERPGDTDVGFRLALSHYSLAALHRSQGKYASALPSYDRAIERLEAIRRTDAGHGEARSLLVSALTGRAAARTRLEQFDTALSDWDAAKQLQPIPVPPSRWFDHALALIGAGKVKEGVARGEALRGMMKKDPWLAAALVGVYSHAGARSAPEPQRREEYVQRARKVLGEMRDQKAFEDAELRTWLASDTDIAWLRQRPEFQEFARLQK